MADDLFGFLPIGGSSGGYNAQSFVIRQHMRRINTSTLVKVLAVTNAGGVAPSGFVDLLPLVDLVDGDNNRVAHNTIFRIPYIRIQGGKNAFIIDPEVGDIGEAIFADRDISSVIANQGQAAPGSARRFSMSDAIYLGGLLNATPEQYVQMLPGNAGITISSPTVVKLIAPDVQINCSTLEIVASSSVTMTTPTFTLNGDAVVTGIVTAAEVDAPIVDVSTTLTVAGKDLGPTHIHDHGTMTASGHTGTVI